MTKIHRGFVDTEYGQMHYRISGQNSKITPLICIHQSPKSSRELIEFMKLAANDRLIIALDMPGHGESYIPKREDATIEGYSLALWSAIDSFKLGKIDLIGHHTGSAVVTEMAYQRPNDVAKIVMISTMVLTQEEREAFKSEFKVIPLDEAGTRFKHIWQWSIENKDPEMTLEQLAFTAAENTRAGEAYEWGHEAAMAYTEYFDERVAALPHKITVLNPNDMLFDLTPRVKNLLQNGRVIDYPDWGLWFLDTDTENAVSEIKKALE